MEEKMDREQKIEYARASLWAPFYTVGMAIRIGGDVPPDLVRRVLAKLQVLYPPLASRVRLDARGAAYLTTAGVGEFPLQVREKHSEDDWAGVFLEQEKIPFDFQCGPIARFFLLRGDQSSDLIVIAPHVVCDGYSISQVMGDAVALLNDPEREVSMPAVSPAVTWKTVRHSFTDNLPLRGLARLVNCFWPKRSTALQQEQYETLYRCYWSRQDNAVTTYSLSAEDTAALSARCKAHGISVTGALVASFLLAQADFHAATPATRSEISVAVNLRDRLIEPPGRAVGVYASSFNVQLRPKSSKSFWGLAAESYRRIHRGLQNRCLLLMPLVLEDLNPAIVDGLVAAVCTDCWSPEFAILTHFVPVRNRMRWLDISNIGRVDLPKTQARYSIQNLLPFPPLVPGGGLALNVLTLNGQMNMILKYRRNDPTGANIAAIQQRAVQYLTAAA